MRASPLAALAALALVLAPALAPAAAAPAPDAAAAEAASSGARVVVAVVDTGVNPYHDFFHRGEPVPEDVLAELGVDPARRLALTRTGSFRADVDADAALWDSILPRELVHFEGTRLVAASVARRGETPVLDEEGHGTAVAAAVLAANPDAIVLVVEGFTAEAVRFATSVPGVDVVSTSFGPLLSAPQRGISEETRRAVLDAGKLHFGATDNSPMPALQDPTAGPWWSIAVSGYEEGSSEGRQVESGTLPDFVADYTQSLPLHDSEAALGVFVGTSFATPRAAGVASAVLLEARRAAGHAGGITPDGLMVDAGGVRARNGDVRDALNATAREADPAEYNALRGVFDFLSVPVPPEAAAPLMGWGVLEPTVVPDAVDHLLRGLPNVRAGLTPAVMAHEFRLRYAYWEE